MTTNAYSSHIECLLLTTLRASLSHQMFGAVESSVTMKLKGTSRSRLRDSEAALLPVPEWRNLYNRVWDVADYGKERNMKKYCRSIFYWV